MWTYIVRRLLLMVPTLFGITVVSFCIMQMAPGDPLLSRLGGSGTAGQSSQTREAFLLQKRDLKLDKPLIFNVDYFTDYTDPIRIAAHYRVLTVRQIADDLEQLAGSPTSDESATRLKFLKSLRIDKFQERLSPPRLTAGQLEKSGLTHQTWEREKRQIREALARAVQGYLLIWCEDTGIHGVPPAMEILQSEQAGLREKIGTIHCLSSMVVNPFVYTYSREPTQEKNRQVMATWDRLWHQVKGKYPPLDPDRRQVLKKKLKELADGSRADMFKQLQRPGLFAEDVPFFAEVVLGDRPFDEKVVAAEFLRLSISERVKVDVPLDAPDMQVEQVIANWTAHYEATREQYHPGFWKKTWYIAADTQYAHMVWRLLTFDFGRSALKTREPVRGKIWDALLVSAPLMIMAELFIYLVAIPLGIVCAVNRGKLLDRLISLKLFFLYSVPPFVAGMIFLLLFCYGYPLKWFPMERLHSPGADQFTWGRYLLDYLWHAVLPVTCLALFSLAALAMYARTSMLDVLGQDYIRTARAKGVSGMKVIIKHALRNSLIPIITIFAGFLPAMLGGSVLIEYIFNIPGMGRLSFTSIEQKDFPTLMALIYVQAIVVMVSILLTDMLYVLVDPRISFQSQEQAT